MKKLNLLFTALLLLCCVGTAKAEEVTIDGIKYDVVTKAKLATVISGGNYSGDIVIPETVEHNGVNCSVTSIGTSAFYGRSGLTSIEIPNSVTSIGERAFYNCSGLTSVTIGNSVTSIGSWAFYSCSGLREVHISDIAAWCRIDFASYDVNPLYYANNLYLNGELVTELVIPEGVKEIKNYAFRNCSGLTSIEIPNSVTSIGNYAFYGCSGLTSIVIGNGVTSIGDNAFYNKPWTDNQPDGLIYIGKVLYGYNGVMPENSSVTINEGTTQIFSDAFSGQTNLVSITIPNSVTSIGDSAFKGCASLASITIPNSVTSIGTSTFEDCTSLTEANIPNSVTSIGGRVFRNCSNLESVSIGAGVTKIDDYFFGGCYSLKELRIEDGESDLYIGYMIEEYWSGYEEQHVPTISTYTMFCDCHRLETLYLGRYISFSKDHLGGWYHESPYLYASPFNLKSLKSITINTTEIQGFMFEYCTGLTSVTIGSGVGYISEQAFAKCDNLADVYCLATSVPSTDASAFNGSYPEYMTLHVPAEALSKYQATNPWSTFGNIIPFSFDLTVSTAGYATLYLDYTVEIPTGVEVYTANAVEGEFLKMQLVEGVIPANTGVIVKADAGTYAFKGTVNTAPEIGGNLFKGSVENKMVKVPSSSQAYVLSIVDGEVGMYRAELTDGYFLNNANKAYLLLCGNNLDIYDEEFDTSAGGQLSNGFRFDFGGITGVSEMKTENGEGKTIYDLQGRVIENPTNGIYIIDGKKVLVK